MLENPDNPSLLTMQEAADFLGIARHTLVRILDGAELPVERSGRHRIVRLKDLVEFQKKQQAKSKAALDDLIAESVEGDLYSATDGPPPAIR